MAKVGKGQSPLDPEASSKLREALLEGASEAKALPATWKDLPIGKVYSQVSIWGSTMGMKPVTGLERQGLAACRLQESGTREIVCAHVLALMEYGVQHGFALEDKHTYTDYLDQVFSSLDNETSLDNFHASGMLRRACIRPGQLVYIPMGWMMMERTIGDVYAYGFRTAAFDTTEKSVASFREMIVQLKAFAGEEDPLVKFWDAAAQGLSS